MSQKQCRSCGTTWTASIYACPMCGGFTYDTLSQQLELPIGRQAKSVPELNKWVKKTLVVIKSLPKKEE